MWPSLICTAFTKISEIHKSKSSLLCGHGGKVKKNAARQWLGYVAEFMTLLMDYCIKSAKRLKTEANHAAVWRHQVKVMSVTVQLFQHTRLSQYVTSLSFFHDDQTGVDVVVLCVLQFNSAVVDCDRQTEKNHDHISYVVDWWAWRNYTRSPTRTDVSVSVSVAVLGIFCHFVWAFVGLIPDFLK